jgi:hypothetical protein
MMRIVHLFNLWNVIFTCHGFSLSTRANSFSVAQCPKEILLSPPTVGVMMDDDETICNISSLQRRKLNLLLPTIVSFASFPCLASDVALVKGTVSLPSNMEQHDESPTFATAALYITCRPNRPDNVPQAILQGTRGKAPPVLAARFEHPTSFPFVFELTSNDLTLEGGASNTNGDYWWSQEDLIVSARLDSDGIAATRSPEDLVGRGMYVYTNGRNEPAFIQLQGRGSFGKFATRKTTSS